MPLEDLNAPALVEVGEDARDRGLVGVPGGIEGEVERAGYGALERNLRGRHDREEPALGALVRGRVVPLVGVGHGDDAVAQREGAAALVPGGGEPEVLLREGPPAPLLDAAAGHLVPVGGPAPGRRRGPGGPGAGLHGGLAELDALEGLLEQGHVGGAARVGAGGADALEVGAQGQGLALAHLDAAALGQAGGADGRGSGGEAALLAPLAPGEAGVAVADAPVIGREGVEHAELELAHVLALPGVHREVARLTALGIGGREPVLEPEPLVADGARVVASAGGDLEVGGEMRVPVDVPEG